MLTRQDRIFHYLTLSGLYVLVVGVFTSVSFSALSHILLFFPGVYFSVKWIKSKDIEVKASWWALLGMSLIIALSVVLNWDNIDNPIKSILKIKYFVIGGMSYVSLCYLKRDFFLKKHITYLLYLFLAATTVATISGLIGLWTGFNPLKFKSACHLTRACGLYGMYMTYGYGISLFMVLMATGLRFRKNIFQYINPFFYYFCFFINLIGLYFSYARGAWLGFLLAIPFIFFKEHKKKFFILSFLSIVTLGSAVLFVPKAQDMFLRRTTSNEKRIAFYKTALFAWKEKPFIGWGYRNFEPNVVQIKKRYELRYPNVGGHAHNNFLEHLASTGTIGFLALMIFLWLWLKESYYLQFSFPFVISFLISGMFQYTFGDGENLFLLFLVYMIPNLQLSSSEYSNEFT